ncbi:MFS transporter [Salipaludibacillus keqinensis]|uniref:MFS transporter n=1 Tax=Salipaludibacillus keqinensis TaxID=2045207 RepID=A0A323THD1_9BACI|nr:MFS transporter [Salipaludibacillus keqinensis]PYZ93910.1 MFS transporter [Salipaludibacillus keqinensis]
MTKKILKNRSFVSVWIGNATSELGGAFGTFANSILIYQLTGSAMALGSMWLLYFVPSLVLQLFIGPFIDRWSRKWIMIFSQWARGLIFLVPIGALLTGTLEPWHIFIVQLFIGLISPFYVPANQAILPTIVSKEQLQSANAYIDGTVRLMTFMAPLLGGIVTEYIGVQPTLIFVSIMLSSSGFLLIFIQEPSTYQRERKTWLVEFMEGTTFFFRKPIIVWLGVFLAFVQFGVGVTMVTTLPYITDELSGSYADYGYFMASFPIGYILGAMIVGKLKFKSRRVLMLGSLVIGGLTFIFLSFNQSISLGILTEIIGGVMMAVFSIHNVTICQQVIPNHLMGKVFSVRLLIVRGAMPLGVVAGGLLSEMMGVRPLYFFIGSLISIVALIGILHPYFRFIDQEVQQENVS